MASVKLNFIKKVTILSGQFDIIWDKTHDGASFSWTDCEIKIGTLSYHKDPVYTLGILSHEIMELIFVGMGARYQSVRDGTYLFNFSHQTFENAIQIHIQALSKFIKP